MFDRLMIKIYDVLHRRYSSETMAWHLLRANVGDKILTLRIYGPKGMRMTDVVFEEMPDKVKWYKLNEID